MGGNLRGRGVVKAEFGTCSAQTTPFLSGGVNGYIEEVAFGETYETSRTCQTRDANGWTHSL